MIEIRMKDGSVHKAYSLQDTGSMYIAETLKGFICIWKRNIEEIVSE